MKSDFLTNLFFRALQTVSIATMIVRLLLPVAIVAALYLLWRIARNLEKPPKLTEEVKIVRKSLSETLKENRTRCKMTQEFVAETIGVSRQAVSKWENGTSEPNTSNLMALARLYGIPAEDLLGCIHYNPDVINADRQGKSPYDFSPQAIDEIRQIKAILDREEN